ncbi:MAG: PTS sugar transporter subunit IIA [Longimicrobiales bacterium]
MSSAPVRGIVVAHGSMAAGLVDAVRQITGLDETALIPLSNRGLSPEALAAEVRARVQGRTLVFTDLQSGSCGFAVRRHCSDIPDLVVISGVNLPILLEFAMFRDQPLAELVARLVNKGRSAIGSSNSSTEPHEHRVVSGG